jgi:putative endonuclease
MYYVYILKSQKTGKHYIGSTPNIEKRLNEHNNNWTTSTKGKGPWEMIYSEVFETKTEGLKREKEIKRYKGGNSFKNLIRPIC